MSGDGPDTPKSSQLPEGVKVKLGAFGKPHAYFDHIGRICAEWAWFEARLDMTIGLLSGLDDRTSAAITSQINGPVPRLRAILSLLELKGVAKEVRDAVMAFMQKTHGIADDRNRVVHDPWVLDDIRETVLQRRSARIGKTFFHGYKEVSADELMALEKKINDHHIRFIEIAVQIQDDPVGPFRRTPAPKPP